MAYNNKYNPDALPAHAEPEQAAQMLAGQQPAPPQKQHQQQPPTPQQHVPGSFTPPHPPYSHPPQHQYQNKPQPPLPPSSSQYHREEHRRPSNPPTVSPSHGSQGPYHPPPVTQGYSSYGGAGAVAGAGGGGNGGGSGGVTGSWPPRNQSTSPRPPHQGHPPPATSLPTAGSDPSLFPLFQAVDVKGTGQLSEAELSKALRNGDYSSFDPQTVRMMIKMFDHNKKGTVGFDEFCGLWGFLAAWRTLFDRFDEDRSGYISYSEYSKALMAFGYNLTTGFVHTLYRIYDRRGSDEMSFDLFVQSCISLKRMTDVFKRYDTDRDGYITLSFEEFLIEILNQR